MLLLPQERSPQERQQSTGERDKKSGNAVEPAPGLTPGTAPASSATPSRVNMIELDDWILAVSFDEREEVVGSIEQVLVGSGAAVSCQPEDGRVREW